MHNQSLADRCPMLISAAFTVLVCFTSCKDAAPSDEAATASARSASAATAVASASAVAPVKTPADPLLAALVGDAKDSKQLEQADSAPAVGLAWRIPKDWESSSSFSKEETKSVLRKKVTPKKQHWGMSVSVLTDAELEKFVGEAAFPKAGAQPYGGTLPQGKWTPFTELTFGRSRLEAVATHGTMRGTKYVYVMFRAPKGDHFVQVKLSYQDGKEDRRDLLTAMARSVGVE